MRFQSLLPLLLLASPVFSIPTTTDVTADADVPTVINALDRMQFQLRNLKNAIQNIDITRQQRGDMQASINSYSTTVNQLSAAVKNAESSVLADGRVYTSKEALRLSATLQGLLPDLAGTVRIFREEAPMIRSLGISGSVRGDLIGLKGDVDRAMEVLSDATPTLMKGLVPIFKTVVDELISQAIDAY
jgi:hypothetical protein